MTPKELLKFKEYNRKGKDVYNYETKIWEIQKKDDFQLDLRGYASERKKLKEYQDENCVVAFSKNCLGVIMLMKAKIEYFGFIITAKDFRGYTLFRIELPEIFQYLTSTEDKLNITEPELWKRFQAKLGLMELEK